MDALLRRTAAVIGDRPQVDDYAGRLVDVVAVPLGLAHASLVRDAPDVPSPVTGKPGERYLEAFDHDAFTRTLRQRGQVRPARDVHGALIGSALDIMVRGDTLAATIMLSRTTEGDRALEQVRSRAYGATSIGFRPISHKIVQTANGPVVLRTEVDLREVSLAPSDKALHTGARVLAVRSAVAAPAKPSWQEMRAKRLADDAKLDRMLARHDDREAMDAGLMTRADFESKWGRLPTP
jgi:HK97 family phage prohead protease